MKLGIALAGGGARGSYQIGAWKALLEHGIFDKISAFSGASVGSLNAVLFAMGEYDLAYETWMSLNKDSLFVLEKNILKRIVDEKLKILDRGVYSTDKLEELVFNTVDFDKIKGKEVYITTTHLISEKGSFFDLLYTNYRHYIKKDEQIRYININSIEDKEKPNVLLASCAIPVAFQPVKVKNEIFYDGGVLDNTPYKPLIEAGCDTIIVIDLFTFSPMRVRKIKEANVYTVYPKRSLRGILDFSHKHIKHRFDLGYQDMNKLLEQIKDDLL